MVRTSAGLTVIAQAPDGAAPVDASLTGSLDVFLVADVGPGTFELYVEAGSTPSTGSLGAGFPALNGDAGSALDGAGRGRPQISELKYDLRLPNRAHLAVGLLDPTAYLDTSPIANDENTQFVSAALVNNPSIEIPDYVPGAVYRQRSRAGAVRLRAALTASNGLADNSSASYGALFDVGDDDRGLFAAVELDWSYYRVGAWANGRDHVSLVDGQGGRSASGVWAAFARQLGRNGVAARVGLADRDMIEAAGFGSVAYRTVRAFGTLGVAVAGTLASDRLVGAEDSLLVEAYWRVRAAPGLEISPMLQHVWNAGLDGSAAADRLTVVGLRVHRTF